METRQSQSRRCRGGWTDNRRDGGVPENALAPDSGGLTERQLPACAGTARADSEARWRGAGIADKAKETYRQRIRQLTRRTGGRSLPEVVERLRTYMPGWKGYYAGLEGLLPACADAASVPRTRRVAASSAVLVALGGVTQSDDLRPESEKSSAQA